MQDNTSLDIELIQFAAERILQAAIKVEPNNFDIVRRILNVGFHDYFFNYLEGYPKSDLEASSRIEIQEDYQPVINVIQEFLSDYAEKLGNPNDLQQVLCHEINRCLYPEYFTKSTRAVRDLIKDDPDYLNKPIIWNTKFPLLGFKDLEANSDWFPYANTIQRKNPFKDNHFVFPIHVAYLTREYELFKLLVEQGSKLIFRDVDYTRTDKSVQVKPFHRLNGDLHPINMVIQRKDIALLKYLIEKEPMILENLSIHNWERFSEYLIKTLSFDDLKSIFDLPGLIDSTRITSGGNHYRLLTSANSRANLERRQFMRYFLNDCPNMKFDTTKKAEIKKVCEAIMVRDGSVNGKVNSGLLTGFLSSKAVAQTDLPEYLQHCLLKQLDKCYTGHIKAILKLGADPKAEVEIDGETRTFFEFYLTKAINDQTKPYLSAVSLMLEYMANDDELINHDTLHLLFDREIAKNQVNIVQVRALAKLSAKRPEVCLEKIKQILRIEPGLELFRQGDGKTAADYAMENQHEELLSFLILHGGLTTVDYSESNERIAALSSFSAMVRGMLSRSARDLLLERCEDLVKQHKEFSKGMILNILGLHLENDYLVSSGFHMYKMTFLPKLIESYIENYPDENNFKQTVEGLLMQYNPESHRAAARLFADEADKQRFISELQADVDDYAFALKCINGV